MSIQNKLIIAIALLAFPVLAAAQYGNTTVNRQAWDKGLSLLENYEIYSAVIDQEAYYDFIGLFANEDLLIFNDLLGSRLGNAIKVKDYADFQLNNAKSKNVFISNINKKRIWSEDNLIKMEYEFDKAISYASPQGIFFDSKDFYGQVYKMEAVIAYDPQTDFSYIERLQGSVDSDKSLPDNFYTLIVTSGLDKDLKFHSRKIALNRYGQAILDDKVSKRSFSYPDPDVIVTPTIDDIAQIVTTKYRTNRLTLKAHCDMAMNNPLKCDDNSRLSSIKSKETMSAGIDFGYNIPSMSRLKIGIFAGFEFSQIKLDMGYHNSDYYYQSTADVDGDNYVRHYRDLSLTQNVKITRFSVPVYADFSLSLGNLLGVYFDVGAKINLNASIKNDVKGSAYTYGIYPQYGNLNLGGEWGYNSFGQNTYSTENLANGDLPEFSKITAELMCGTGFRIKIPTTTLSINLGVNYLMGIMPLIKENYDGISLSASRPVVFNTIDGVKSYEKMRSLTNGFGKAKTQMLKISIGLNYKF